MLYDFELATRWVIIIRVYVINITYDIRRQADRKTLNRVWCDVTISDTKFAY